MNGHLASKDDVVYEFEFPSQPNPQAPNVIYFFHIIYTYIVFMCPNPKPTQSHLVRVH